MKTTGTMHFKSTAGYHKWLAYGHMHGKFKVAGVKRVIIRGRVHNVKHK